jgi:hypothetical protein
VGLAVGGKRNAAGIVSRTESERAAPASPVPANPAVEPQRTATRVVQATSDVLQFALASAVAATAAYAIWRQLPDELDVRTDIVGYPIHSNFNGSRYFWLYWLIVGFVPVLTLVLFLILRRVIPRTTIAGTPRYRQPAEEVPLPPASHTEVVAVGIARLLFVGAIFGLEIAIWMSESSRWILAIGIPVMVGYAAVLYLGAIVVERLVHLPTTFWDRVALTNAFAVPFCVAGLYSVSRSTEVTVVSSGRVHEYPWFPIWAAAGLTAAALFWVLRTVRLARVASAFRELERRALLIIAGPVVLFLFVALLPGSWSGIDFFHEGELLAGARLVE